MEYLGFWVTRTGIQPIDKKLESIVKMMPPKNTKEVRAFIVIVNYKRDMWEGRSHLLHPLTELASPKVEFKWTDVEHKAFDNINRTVAHNTSLEYLDFNK